MTIKKKQKIYTINEYNNRYHKGYKFRYKNVHKNKIYNELN